MLNFRAFLQKASPRAGGEIRVRGIDLGTTNSAMGEIAIDPATAKEVPMQMHLYQQQGLNGVARDILVPSVVAIHEGEVYVGRGAKQMQEKAPSLGLEHNRNLFFECKNEMGLKKTYANAPETFRSASQIGGHVLSFLSDCGEAGNVGYERTVVTVPASFQLAQRSDTIKAAEYAGIKLDACDLLDEPSAAFIDYLMTYGAELEDYFKKPRNVMVFDFGGGTCDVTVFNASINDSTGRITLAPMAVSRYHRLGGGDIDAAIVYDVLLPQFCTDNNLVLDDLDYDDKKLYLEPFLKPVAEKLKIELCEKYETDVSKKDLSVILDETLLCRLHSTIYNLKRPSLTLEQFQKILDPFLDKELLYTTEGEYRLTCSIFAPITDALNRCRMKPKHVDCVLLAGGSSLIPQAVESIKSFFNQSKILQYPNRKNAKLTVARGAAFHALALALTGKGIINPVSQSNIAVMTQEGPIEIIPAGTELPYPADGPGVLKSLAVPEQSVCETLKMRLTLIDGLDNRTLCNKLWNITGIVNKGDPIALSYRFDENQLLSLEAFVDDGVERQHFKAEIENPLTHIVNPNRSRIKILEIEEELRTADLTDTAREYKQRELSDLLVEIGQRERAITILKKILNEKNQPDADILNKIGLIYGELGNKAFKEKMLQKACTSYPNYSAPFFNLAQMQDAKGNLKEAMTTIDTAIRVNPRPAYNVYKGLLLQKAGNDQAAKELVKTAMNSFSPVQTLDDWELSWYKTASCILNLPGKTEDADKEFQRRAAGGEKVVEGILPIRREPVTGKSKWNTIISMFHY
jgi:molecular chaperone DnaK